MTNKMVPEIRFDGFRGEWEKLKFEKLLDPKDGVRRGPFGSALKKDIFVSKSDYVVYEQYNAIYDNYQTRYNITKEKYEELKNFALHEGDFILSGAGTIGKISRVPKGIKPGVFNQALIRFRINREITDSEFFIQFVRSDDMQRYLTSSNAGSAMTNLVPMSEVKKWSINIPEKKEQQKIGEFFKNLDDRIALQQQQIKSLKESKQGFLQKLFPKDGERVPEVRFDGFSEEWEQRELGEISKKITKKNKDKKYLETLTNSAELGVISQAEYFDKQISNDANIDGYYVVSPNDFVYNPRISKHAPVGPIKRNKLNRTGVMSPLYYIFTVQEIDKVFIEKYFETVYWHKFMKLNGDSGARSDRLAIKDSVFKLMPIPYPSIEEQQKIGEFFKNLDDAIEAHEKELELLQETKKGFLQKMFV
ncbi:type I restriction enzyme, S subunit [Pelagirhabdus alkalitolerans]|uniref:Type I restriction enzyme, S subunit n=1 Tax=Pelagirhabdus alkalitolerans TaxID=1612202 RepID=A0A1G6GP79_9BACI|nr:restriction endonuclease subunit S [Pelagirhabdus alkalitolerans]SDB83812.1 type I restriction enzyme, S subunit [Pelagirhabdus alkalitolerans]